MLTIMPQFNIYNNTVGATTQNPSRKRKISTLDKDVSEVILTRIKSQRPKRAEKSVFLWRTTDKQFKYYCQKHKSTHVHRVNNLPTVTIVPLQRKDLVVNSYNGYMPFNCDACDAACTCASSGNFDSLDAQGCLCENKVTRWFDIVNPTGKPVKWAFALPSSPKMI